jgi:hypothetical protein
VVVGLNPGGTLFYKVADVNDQLYILKPGLPLSNLGN